MTVPLTLIAVGVVIGIGLCVEATDGIGGPIRQWVTVRKELLTEVESAVLLPSAGSATGKVVVWDVG